MSTTERRIVAAAPLRKLLDQLRQEARAARGLQDERGATLREEAARRLEGALEQAAELQEVSTGEAAPFLGIKPESVAALCRRGRLPGASRVAGVWRIPVRVLEKVA